MKAFLPHDGCAPSRWLPAILVVLLLATATQFARADQPTTYARQADFSDHSENFPDEPQNGTDLDNEFNAVKTTLDETLQNLALIQRDDGALANSSVHVDALSSSVLSLLATDINPRGAWLTSTSYAVSDLVSEAGSTYVCLTAHTSGTFATDLAAGKWQLFSGIGTTTLGVTQGGTGLNAVAQGDLLFGSAADTISRLAKSTSATRYLANTGTNNNPAWAQVSLTTGVTGTLPIANGGTGGTDEATAKAALNLETGVDVQAFDATLAAVAGWANGSNKIPYTTSTDTIASLDFLDQDDMASDSATAVASQQSVKAYVDNKFTITPWVQYTPTLSGFGTATGVSVWSRRVGDTLEIRGRFTCGTVTAAEGRMTLGYNGTNGGITSSSTKVPNLQLAGVYVASTNGVRSGYTLIESNIGYITFSIQTSGTSGFTKALGGDAASDSATLSITAAVPISGW